MVTIEQKLTLFSKLLNQELKEEVEKKIAELEKEYEAKIAESKYNIDKEAKHIIEDAKKRADIKKIELVSKGRMSSKKEEMLTKEKVIVRFMENLMTYATSFTQTPTYKKYLIKAMNGASELKGYKNPLVVILTPQDVQKYSELVLEHLNELGIEKVSIEESKEDIIGGLIMADPILNMKIDMSMRTIIEESKERIVEIITLALREAGEQVG